MRILANENMPADAVDLLRVCGHDVCWVRSDQPGASDEDLLERARTDGRLLVTFDKDFGGLVFQQGQRASCGVVLFRITCPTSAEPAVVIAGVLEGRDDWRGHFSVVDRRQTRMVPLPPT